MDDVGTSTDIASPEGTLTEPAETLDDVGDARVSRIAVLDRQGELFESCRLARMDPSDDGLEPSGGSCSPGTTADKTEAVAAGNGNCVAVTTCGAKELSILVVVQFPSPSQPVFSLIRQMFERGGLKGQGMTS